MGFSKFTRVKLGEICSIKGGKRLPKGKSLISKPNNHPYIRVKDMSSSNKYISLNDEFEYVESDTQKTISKYTVNKDDIILSIVGTTGLVSIVDSSLDGANLTENCVKLVNLIEATNDYIYYCLTSEIGQNEIKKGIVGSTQPKLPIYNIEKIAVELPPKKEQLSIANILSTLDEKIEINNQINNRLEEMAQSIYKQWFVDFEFPNEYGLPYKSSGGEMVKSELGIIPKGWKVGSATEQFGVQSGGTPKTNVPEYWNGEIPFFTPKDSHVSSIFVIDTEKNITNEGLSKCNSKLYDVGTIFITARGTVGNVAMAGRQMAMNQSCYALIPNEGFNYNYIYFLIIQLVKTLKANASGSVFDAIIVSTFTSLKTVIPGKEIVDQFNEIVQSLFSQVLNNIEENKNLETIRDTLLPKLMSGEIRVPVES
jgi:type I restriction enzyme, S subunit